MVRVSHLTDKEIRLFKCYVGLTKRDDAIKVVHLINMKLRKKLS